MVLPPTLKENSMAIRLRGLEMTDSLLWHEFFCSILIVKLLDPHLGWSPEKRGRALRLALFYFKKPQSRNTMRPTKKRISKSRLKQFNPNLEFATSPATEFLDRKPFLLQSNRSLENLVHEGEKPTVARQKPRLYLAGSSVCSVGRGSIWAPARRGNRIKLGRLFALFNEVQQDHPIVCSAIEKFLRRRRSKRALFFMRRLSYFWQIAVYFSYILDSLDESTSRKNTC